MPFKHETVAGRSAVADLINDAWDKLVALVEDLPARTTHDGIEDALDFGETHLRTFVDACAVGRPETPEQAIARHQIHQLISGGFLRILVEDSRAGRNFRRAFLRCVEREMVAPSIRATFAASRDAMDSSYEANTGEE